MREFKSFYKTVGGNEGNKCHYPTRLDTYGCGCQHDCSYCYAKSLRPERNHPASRRHDGLLPTDRKDPPRHIQNDSGIE